MYTFREASEMDRAALGQIFYQSWQSAYREILPPEVLDNLTPASAEPKGRIDPKTTLVLADGEKVIGLTVVGASRTPEKSDWGEIYSLYLLPDYFGQGWGKALLELALERLTDLGYSHIHLWVIAQNERAQRLYQRNHFRQSDQVKTREFLGTMIQEVEYIYQNESKRS